MAYNIVTGNLFSPQTLRHCFHNRISSPLMIFKHDDPEFTLEEPKTVVKRMCQYDGPDGVPNVKAAAEARPASFLVLFNLFVLNSYHS